MHFALIDRVGASEWHDAEHCFGDLAAALAADGHRVSLVDAAAPALGHPIIAGLIRESDVADLIASRRAAAAVARLLPDACIAPFRGGLAHGVLMARACAEIPSNIRVLVVADRPSRPLAPHGDSTQSRIAPLVADALERFVVARCDGLLAARAGLSAEDNLGIAGPTLVEAPADLTHCTDVIAVRGRGCERVVFIGPFRREAGVVDFIDAIERLAAVGIMRERMLVFVGPIADGRMSLGRHWLGRRAQGWSFPFRVVETASWREAVQAFGAAPGVAFIPRMTRAALRDLAGIGADVPLPVTDAKPSLERRLRETMAGGAETALARPDDLRATAARIVATCTDRPSITMPHSAGLSFCIVHFDRPALLEQAVDSVLAEAAPGPLEVLVIDNGSRRLESRRMLHSLAARASVRVFRLDEPVPVPAALNKVAGEARHEFLVFLDDDNVMAAGGVSALARAAGNDRLDVIASNLDIFDDDDEAPGPTAAEMVFIGPAASAGLFFNGFGDTSMAFRRSAFAVIAGFPETGGPYPAWDWMLLAKAQAAGLRIGVLQRPAFRYRRSLSKGETHWQKYDQHGVRQRLLALYGDAFDPRLVAGLAQALSVECS